MMKSNSEQLLNRGYIGDLDKTQYLNFTLKQLLKYLHSKDAWKRSIGAHFLKKFPADSTIMEMCNQLSKEKKLYTKIEISDTLASFGCKSLPFLIPLLGTIGTNQIKEIPNRFFKKKSYPLPRDIIARIIIRIGEPALPYLEDVLKNNKRSQILEAIDAIGHICFYSNSQIILPVLWDVLAKYPEEHLITWKIIRCFSAFPSENVRTYLQKKLQDPNSNIFKHEISRSLSIIEKRE